MVSRYGELPSTVRVQCPNCGVFASISLKYTEGDTGDYEGVCDAELERWRSLGNSENESRIIRELINLDAVPSPHHGSDVVGMAGDGLEAAGQVRELLPGSSLVQRSWIDEYA